MFGLDDALMGPAITGAMSVAGGLFNRNKGFKNPADAANKYLNQIPGTIKPYYDPFINAGKGMMPGMNDIYTQMMSNPTEFFNNLASGYKQSPGYAAALKEAMGGIENASAAGGMAGSAMHQKLAGEEASNMAAKDFQQYIDNLLGITKTGLQGGENTVNRGYDASKELASDLGSVLAQQAQYGYAGQDAENKANSQNWTNIFSGAASVMPWLFSGGNNPADSNRAPAKR